MPRPLSRDTKALRGPHATRPLNTPVATLGKNGIFLVGKTILSGDEKKRCAARQGLISSLWHNDHKGAATPRFFFCFMTGFHSFDNCATNFKTGLTGPVVVVKQNMWAGPLTLSQR